MKSLRAALYPLRLVGARLSRRSAPLVLVVLGIAAGASVVLGGRAGALVAQDRAVAQAIERIPDGQRSVRAVWFGLPGLSEEPYARLDARAEQALAAVGVPPPTPVVLFRETSIAGTFAGLGGVDDLGRWVTLRSGRLPRQCTAERCEVLRLRGQGRLPQPDGLKLVEVGEAVLDDRTLFGDFLAPTDNALAEAEVSPSLARAAGYHRPPPAPLFLAEGVDELAASPSLDRIFRSYAWVAPLRAGEPRLWQIDDLADGVVTARSELQSASFAFDLLAPVEELREAQATSRAAGRRLGVVGGEAAALLFAFALLAAMTLRPDLLAVRRRLAWYGARGWQLALVTVAESAALAVAGTVIGLAVGLLGAAVVAERAGAPVAGVLLRSILSGGGLALAVAVAAAATAVLVGVVAARASRRRFGFLDAAAVAAAALVVLEVARGDGEGDLPLLLPALVTFAVAVLTARLLRPTLRLVERLARGRSLGLRIASLSLARNPGYAIAATAFLVVSFGLALFAESYRSTLDRGERDQAAHRVPLDYVVREDLRRLIPVQDAARSHASPGCPASRRRRCCVSPAASGGSRARPGSRSSESIPASSAHLNGWRDSEVPESRQELASRIEAPPATNGPRLGRTLRARIEGGGPVRLFAEIEGPTGRFSRVALGEPLPAEARGGSARRDRDRAGHPDPGAGRRRGASSARVGDDRASRRPRRNLGLGRRRRREDRRLDRPLHAHECRLDPDHAQAADRAAAGARHAAVERRRRRPRPAAAPDRRRAADGARGRDDRPLPRRRRSGGGRRRRGACGCGQPCAPGRRPRERGLAPPPRPRTRRPRSTAHSRRSRSTCSQSSRVGRSRRTPDAIRSPTGRCSPCRWRRSSRSAWRSRGSC